MSFLSLSLTRDSSFISSRVFACNTKFTTSNKQRTENETVKCDSEGHFRSLELCIHSVRREICRLSGFAHHSGLPLLCLCTSRPVPIGIQRPDDFYALFFSSSLIVVRNEKIVVFTSLNSKFRVFDENNYAQ